MTDAIWRMIAIEEHSAAMNMGIDEAILEGVRDGVSTATIRFYRWKPSAVSIGRFQGILDEVNMERCKAAGVDVVRRITGGGAVYHDFEGELTYSVIAPQSVMPKGIRESYGLICGWVIAGLGMLGINAQFAPINDITVEGKKISGNAQTRRDGVLLQHGTILYSIDSSAMFSLLNVSKEKISDKAISSAHERVTSVCAVAPGTSMKALYESMYKGFCEGKSIAPGTLSNTEAIRAAELSKRYASDSWNSYR